MNSMGIIKPKTLVNIRAIIWDLLSQWKAVLIVALLIAALMTGYKYHKAMNIYKAQLAGQAAAEQQTTAPADEQITEILEALPEEDRTTVDYMIHMKDWVDNQKEYIDNSILMNVEPTNQRTLMLDFYIDAGERSDSILASLTYGYIAFCNNDKLIEGIRQIIDPDKDIKYIAELIIAPNYGNYISGSDDGDAVFQVKIVLPEGVDAAAIEEVVKNAMIGYSAEMSRKVAPHTLTLLRACEAKVYNTTAVNNKNTIIANIFNIQNTYIKTMENNLSDQQKGAISAITALKKAAKNAEDVTDTADIAAGASEEPVKPGLSKKYALFGFVLGAMLYAFLYLVLVIIKGNLAAAGDLEYYTGSRLIGEVYSETDHKGIRKLLHSKIVDRLRYSGKTDADVQIGKIAASLEMIGKHAGADKLSLLSLSPNSKKEGSALRKIAEAVREKGIDTEIVDLADGVDESHLMAVNNCIMASGNDCKASDIIKLTELCREFDAKQLGNIYFQEI